MNEKFRFTKGNCALFRLFENGVRSLLTDFLMSQGTAASDSSY